MGKVLKTKILELFNNGISCIDISKKLRCAKSTVSYHCSSKIENKFDENHLIKYQNFYDKGYSLKETAKNFGISRQTLGKKLVVRKLTKLQIKQKAKIRTDNYRVKVKKECIEYKGGKCYICGYNKYQGSLDFHHINPKDKDFTISGGTKSFESLKQELDKCILVCRNCHSEIHAGLIHIGM